jgi:hypothetical protein
MTTTSKSLTAATTTDVSRSPLARSAGLLALAAGGLFTITQLVTVATLDRSNLMVSILEPVFLINGSVYFGAFCLLMLALVAIYAREGHRAGKFWTIGACAAVVGTFALGANVGWFDVFVAPWIALVAPESIKMTNVGSLPIGGLSSYVLFLIGWVLFGVASFRARVFPVAISLAIVVSALIAWPSAQAPYGIPFGLTIATLGVLMLRRSTAANEIAEPATSSR